MAKDKDDEGRYIGKCECGGDVRGVSQFGRLWTWCKKCTPVINVKMPTRSLARTPQGKP